MESLKSHSLKKRTNNFLFFDSRRHAVLHSLRACGVAIQHLCGLRSAPEKARPARRHPFRNVCSPPYVTPGGQAFSVEFFIPVQPFWGSFVKVVLPWRRSQRTDAESSVRTEAAGHGRRARPALSCAHFTGYEPGFRKGE